MRYLIKFFIIGISLFSMVSCDKEDDATNQNDTAKKTYFDANEFNQNGLVAYYTFNGNANTFIGNVNGQVYGTTLTTDRFGNQNSSYHFNGIDNYIEIPNSNEFNTSSGTICFWIKVPYTEDENKYSVISKTDGATNGYILKHTDSDNCGTTIFAFDELGYSGLGVVDSYKNEFNFFVFTFSERHWQIYYNGNLTSRSEPGIDVLFNDNEYQLFIGKEISSENPVIDYSFFEGDIDDLLIYNRALSEEEIIELYNWK